MYAGILFYGESGSGCDNVAVQQPAERYPWNWAVGYLQDIQAAQQNLVLAYHAHFNLHGDQQLLDEEVTSPQNTQLPSTGIWGMVGSCE